MGRDRRGLRVAGGELPPALGDGAQEGRAVRRAAVVSWKRGGTRMEVAAGLQARWWRQMVVTTAVSEGVVGIFYFF